MNAVEFDPHPAFAPPLPREGDFQVSSRLWESVAISG